MAGHGVHHLFSVLPRGTACLAIFGRDGFAVRNAMQRGPQSTSHMHLPGIHDDSLLKRNVVLGNPQVMH